MNAVGRARDRGVGKEADGEQRVEEEGRVRAAADQRVVEVLVVRVKLVEEDRVERRPASVEHERQDDRVPFHPRDEGEDLVHLGRHRGL